MTKVLVTGATGFIGRFLVPNLLQHHVSVRILVRKPQPALFPEKVDQYVGDLTKPDSLKGIGDGIDILFHLGGFAHAWNREDEVKQHQQINFLGTQHILNECVRANVHKCIFFSSIKAVKDADHCIDEKWDGLPDTPYGIAKRAAEEVVLTTGKKHAMHVCVLRLALVYGPFLKGNLYQMLRAVDKGYFLPIPPVKNNRSLVSIYDVCQAAWLAAQNKQANGKIYYVTDKKNYSTYDIYSLMREVCNRSRPNWAIPLWIFKSLAWLGDKGEKVIAKRLPFNSEVFDKLFGSSHYSSACIQKELGFNPRYLLQDVLPEIVHAYRKEQAL